MTKTCPCCRRPPAEHDAPKFVLECRNPDGTLLFRNAEGTEVPQPPMSPAGTLEWTENELCDYYFRHNPQGTGESVFGNGRTASMQEIAAWFATKNWYWRRKTW